MELHDGGGGGSVHGSAFSPLPGASGEGGLAKASALQLGLHVPRHASLQGHSNSTSVSDCISGASLPSNVEVKGLANEACFGPRTTQRLALLRLSLSPPPATGRG